MRLSEVKELTEKMFTTFTPAYVMALGVAMVDQAKRRRGSATDRVIPYKLLQMPPASEPLISGFLSKRVSARFPRCWFCAICRPSSVAASAPFGGRTGCVLGTSHCLLLVFDSIFGQVRCAVSLQQRVQRREAFRCDQAANAGVEPCCFPRPRLPIPDPTVVSGALIALIWEKDSAVWPVGGIGGGDAESVLTGSVGILLALTNWRVPPAPALFGGSLRSSVTIKPVWCTGYCFCRFSWLAGRRAQKLEKALRGTDEPGGQLRSPHL